MRIILITALAAAVAGCGSINASTSAALNAGGSDYVGARKNIQTADDMKFAMWADAACALPLGSLQRQASVNPRAVSAALTACPIANVGVVNVQSGGITVEMSPK